MYSIYELGWLFLIYGFLGWCVEVCFVAVTHGQVVNRGFLNGPVCPIYGVGMLGTLVLLWPISGRLPALFFFGMCLCSLVELVGGWALEKIFHTRWWDYTDEPYNLNGYICLRYSIMWGFAVTFAVRLVHPTIFALVTGLPRTLGLVLVLVLYGLFLTDFGLTLGAIIGLRRQMTELQRVAAALHTLGDDLSDHLGHSALAGEARMQQRKEHLAESHKARRQQLEQRRQELLTKLHGHPHFFARRLYGAFPAMHRALREHFEHPER